MEHFLPLLAPLCYVCGSQFKAYQGHRAMSQSGFLVQREEALGQEETK